jgi:hypothetical protein
MGREQHGKVLCTLDSIRFGVLSCKWHPQCVEVSRAVASGAVWNTSRAHVVRRRSNAMTDKDLIRSSTAIAIARSARCRDELVSVNLATRLAHHHVDHMFITNVPRFTFKRGTASLAIHECVRARARVRCEDLRGAPPATGYVHFLSSCCSASLLRGHQKARHDSVRGRQRTAGCDLAQTA